MEALLQDVDLPIVLSVSLGAAAALVTAGLILACLFVVLKWTWAKCRKDNSSSRTIYCTASHAGSNYIGYGPPPAFRPPTPPSLVGERPDPAPALATVKRAMSRSSLLRRYTEQSATVDVDGYISCTSSSSSATASPEVPSTPQERVYASPMRPRPNHLAAEEEPVYVSITPKAEKKEKHALCILVDDEDEEEMEEVEERTTTVEVKKRWSKAELLEIIEGMDGSDV